jgi:2-keto-3-deoxy-L-rhamnonate aldolase RhmA
MLRGSQKGKKIHQSAPIRGVKGVEIGPTDLSSSTEGLPNSLHESRQRYAIKADRKDHSQVERCI